MYHNAIPIFFAIVCSTLRYASAPDISNHKKSRDPMIVAFSPNYCTIIFLQ